MREECHSKFEDPEPEEKKDICEYEDVSCLFACEILRTNIDERGEGKSFCM